MHTGFDEEDSQSELVEHNAKIGIGNLILISVKISPGSKQSSSQVQNSPSSHKHNFDGGWQDLSPFLSLLHALLPGIVEQSELIPHVTKCY